MTEDIKSRGVSFAKFLAGMSPEDRARANEMSRQVAREEHKRFSEAFKAGQCCFCGDALTAFDQAKPCRHWLLKPDGFGKEHFELLAKQHSWSVLENYLRWVANEEAFAKNINDLAGEGTGKLVELTIRHKNLEWSFSCGANDLSGHEGGGEHSKRPHYHFQMYVDGKPLIRYNDFHLPLSEADVGFLEYMRENPGKVQRRVAGGAGMNEVLDESMLEDLVTMGRSGASDDEAESAPIKLDTLIVAEPGKTIRGRLGAVGTGFSLSRMVILLRFRGGPPCAALPKAVEITSASGPILSLDGCQHGPCSDANDPEAELAPSGCQPTGKRTILSRDGYQDFRRNRDMSRAKPPNRT